MSSLGLSLVSGIKKVEAVAAGGQRAGVDGNRNDDVGAGLAYVLSVLPKVCEGDLPEEIVLVGLEGELTTQMIDRAAELSIAIAAHGLKDLK